MFRVTFLIESNSLTSVGSTAKIPYVCYFILQWLAIFSKRFSVDLKGEYQVFHNGSPFFNIYHLLSDTCSDAWYAFYLLGLLLPCILLISLEEVTDNVENKDEIYNKLSNSSLGH